jgi:hypothetical protein
MTDFTTTTGREPFDPRPENDRRVMAARLASETTAGSPMTKWLDSFRGECGCPEDCPLDHEWD